MSLDRLLGTWDVTMRHAALPEPVTGRQRCERVLDGAFLVLTSTYDHPQVPDAMEGTGGNSLDRGATWQHDVAIAYRRVLEARRAGPVSP